MVLKTAILVLAAGESKRMGCAKQLLPYNNHTLITHCIKNCLNSGIGDVFCVLGANFNLVKQEVEKHKVVKIIKSTTWQKGIGESIKAGIRVINDLNEYTSVLIVLADQPFISVLTLKKLVLHAVEYNNGIVATCYKSGMGVPAVFPSSYFSELLKIEPGQGAKKIINTHIDTVGLVIPAIEKVDIDTHSEYKKYIEQSKRL
ncbi:MAG: nucleotidyltransferase family protein [Bacteroidia bacterium]